MEIQLRKKYRELLLSEKTIMQAQLASLKKDQNRSSGPISADFSEQALDTENDQVIDALSGLDIKKLDRIEAALKSIENGSYGLCKKCGGKIGTQRLDAIPYAQFCIECSK